MKKYIGFLSFFVFLLVVTAVFYFLKNSQTILSPIGTGTPPAKPLLAYAFENLKKTKFPASKIIMGPIVDTSPDSQSQMFYFFVPQSPGSSVTKKVSGLINIPQKPGNYPVIVMFRGYAPRETYKSGIGTQPSALVLAKNGFITLAPDFLGFGESASPSADPFEERFQTYTTGLTLLSSLSALNEGLDASYSGKMTANLNKIGLWGHSNGGHIALSVLAISGVSYPTVLWAPVSKSFPYSILYYTDEYDDQGKALRKVLSNFENNYDTEMFSPPRYYPDIKSPIQIHQGMKDEEVPVWWSDELAETLKKNNVDVTYLTYPDADHNLLPGGWTSAVQNEMSFYHKYFDTE